MTADRYEARIIKYGHLHVGWDGVMHMEVIDPPQHVEEVNLLSNFQTLLAKAKVIVNAAPTYLVGGSVVITVASEEISKAFPSVGAHVAVVAAPVLAGLGAALAIIRRVKPVPAAERGILPPTSGA